MTIADMKLIDIDIISDGEKSEYFSVFILLSWGL